MIEASADSGGAEFGFLIVDDHPLFREALHYAVSATYPDAEIRECASLAEALEALDQYPNFDLALLDLKIPDANGFDGLLKLRTHYPRLPIVVVSGHEDREIVKTALSYGIGGFIPKSTRKDELTAAIRSVMEGNVFVPEGFQDTDEKIGGAVTNSGTDIASFTPQQLKVIGMIRDGLLNKQIAYELNVSETTVKAHVSKILRKLGVTNRTQAAMEIEKLHVSDLTSIQEKL